VIEIEELALLECDGCSDSVLEELVDPVTDTTTVVVLVGVLDAHELEVPEAVCVAIALVEDDAVTRKTVAVEIAETLDLDEAVCVMTLDLEFDVVIMIDGEIDEVIEAEVLSEVEPRLLSVCT
jgi:hypothetical protein